MKTIRLVHLLDDADVELVMDRETAKYIANVMRREFLLTDDHGASAIADKIAKGLNR